MLSLWEERQLTRSILQEKKLLESMNTQRWDHLRSLVRCPPPHNNQTVYLRQVQQMTARGASSLLLINKIVLTHRHTNLITCRLQLLLYYNSRVNSCGKDCGNHAFTVCLYVVWTFTRKVLKNFALQQSTSNPGTPPTDPENIWAVIQSGWVGSEPLHLSWTFR